MPDGKKKYRKGYGEKRKRRTTTKRKVGKVQIVSPENMQLLTSGKKSPFGQTYTSNYRYVDKIILNVGLSNGVQVFRLGSMFDPDQSGIGHQPLFRDTMSGIYARYQVNYVKYKITPMSKNTGPFMFGIYASQDTGYDPSADLFQNTIEKRNTKWTLVQDNCNPEALTGTISLPKLFGKTKSQYLAERNYSAVIGSNPLIEGLLVMFGQQIDNSTFTLPIMVELSFNTTYYEPIIQAQN